MNQSFARFFSVALLFLCLLILLTACGMSPADRANRITEKDPEPVAPVSDAAYGTESTEGDRADRPASAFYGCHDLKGRAIGDTQLCRHRSRSVPDTQDGNDSRQPTAGNVNGRSNRSKQPNHHGTAH